MEVETFMDTVTNNPIVKDASTQILTHVSTQTDSGSGAENYGTLGSHKVRVSKRQTVTFSGNLSDKKIHADAHGDRITVKIDPRHLLYRDDDSAGGDDKSFSISFQSLPLNPESVCEVEEKEHDALSWGLPVSLELSQTTPSLEKVETLRQSSEDPGFSSLVMPVMTDSEPSIETEHDDLLSNVSLDSFNDDQARLSLNINSDVDSDSASTGKTASLSRQSLSSMDSFNHSFASRADLQCRFTNGKQIKEIVQIINKNMEVSEKASTIIFDKLVKYNVLKPPEWFRCDYGNKTGPALRVNTRFMLEKCSECAGWFSSVKEAGTSLPVFSGKDDYDFHPKLISYIFNKYHSFEFIAEVSQFQSLLFNNSIILQLRGDKNDMDLKCFYETLSFRKLSKRRGGSSNKEFLRCIKGNEKKYRSNCYPASLFFIKEFSLILDKSSSPVKKLKKFDDVLFKSSPDGSHEVDKNYSSKLLMACVNFNLAVQLIENQFKLANLDKFQSKRHSDGVQIKGVTDYSEITDSDQDVMSHLLRIIDALEEEANQMVIQWKSEIDQLPRADKGGRGFEERVLGLKEDNDSYIIKIFIPIRAIFNNILGNITSNMRL